MNSEINQSKLHFSSRRFRFRKKSLALLGVVVLVLAIPLTIYLNQQIQDLRQRAATLPPVYVQDLVACSSTARTPDQLCQKQGYAKSTAVNGINAKGYYWKQCAGAMVTNCTGLSCVIRNLDCTYELGYNFSDPNVRLWGMQNPQSDGSPYPSSYIVDGINTTTYDPLKFGYNCTGYNPGWAVRAACEPTLTVQPTPIRALSCASESLLKTKESRVTSFIKFTNYTSQSIKIYWLDSTGKRVLYNTISSQGSYTQPTYLSHPWVVTNSSDACMAVYLPSTYQNSVTLGSPPTPTVTKAPTPTGGTPITSAPTPTGTSCAQVLTPAKNTSTGQCATFPTACLPAGWVKDSSCQGSPMYTPTPTPNTTGTCSTNSDCTGVTGKPFCLNASGGTPGTCVECRSNSDCTNSKVCSQNKCVAPTAAPTNPPTPTLIVDPSCAFGTAGCPTSTPATTVTISPSPSGSSGTLLSLSLLLHGIGASGDNVLPEPDACQRTNGQIKDPAGCLSTQNPLHPEREVTVEVYDQSNERIKTVSGNVTYDNTKGTFIGTVDLGGDFSAGSYNLRLMVPSYLRKQVAGFQKITPGQQTSISAVDLVSSDVDGDNKLTILDYNALASCYTFPGYAPSCITEDLQKTDVNDDGLNDDLDRNLFRRDLSVQYGD